MFLIFKNRFYEKDFFFILEDFTGMITICLTALCFSSSAQDKNKSVTGELLDMNCYRHPKQW